MIRFLPFTLCALLSACAEKPDEKPTEKAPEVSQPRLVGRVASIPADRRFALIQSYGKWSVETGSILTTQGPDGRAANLVATGEKLGQYAAADIRSGTLEIGDGVYTVVPTPEVTEPPTTEKDQPPSEAKEEQ